MLSRPRCLLQVPRCLPRWTAALRRAAAPARAQIQDLGITALTSLGSRLRLATSLLGLVSAQPCMRYNVIML